MRLLTFLLSLQRKLAGVFDKDMCSLRGLHLLLRFRYPTMCLRFHFCYFCHPLLVAYVRRGRLKRDVEIGFLDR